MAISRARRKSTFGGDGSPTIQREPSVIAITPVLNSTDSAQTTFKAKDPGGFPISYDISYMADSSKLVYINDSSNLPPHLLHPAQITTTTDSAGTTANYRFITRSDESDGSGNSTIQTFFHKYIATDGSQSISSTQSFLLKFQTTFTFDTSVSTINSTYTGNNKVDVTVSAGSSATSQQIGKMGKGYLEYKIIVDGSVPMFGVGTSPFNALYSGSGSRYLYHDGSSYPGPVSTGIAGSGVNDILMFAYDTDAEEVWLGMNGSWGNKIPNTHSGYSVGGDASTHGFKPIFNSGGGGGDNYRIEIISHTQGAQYTIPTGWSLA